MSRVQEAGAHAGMQGRLCILAAVVLQQVMAQQLLLSSCLSVEVGLQELDPVLASKRPGCCCCCCQVRRQVTTEVRAMDGARHPHIVSYHQSYFANGAMTILMEFMDGGSLWDVLQRVSTGGAAAGKHATHWLLL
jgi:serine/threonine protein kinase